MYDCSVLLTAVPMSKGENALRKNFRGVPLDGGVVSAHTPVSRSIFGLTHAPFTYLSAVAPHTYTLIPLTCPN